MKKTCVLFTLGVCLMNVCSYAVAFSDNFESGTLSQWTIEGRRAGRVSTAGIVTRYSSNMARIYQDGWSEVMMSKTFTYQEDMHFSFDMETLCYSQAPGTNNAYYAGAGVNFIFLDSYSNQLGIVQYGSSTSTYSLGIVNPPINSECFLNNGAFEQYSLDVAGVLSFITIDQNALAYVKLQFGSYTSGSIYNMSANCWVDNVLVTPEPATLLLLGLGVLVLRRKK